MKKCPVCGVMMGDNVARCSMCKFDFQKASLGESEQAVAEAKRQMAQKEEQALARAEAKKSEEEKHLAELKGKINAEIATLTAQFESEKLRLESEYAAMQKQAIDDKISIEKELAEKKEELEITRSALTKAQHEVQFIEEDTKARAQKEYDEMIELAKQEQQRIVTEAQQQTEKLAIEVEKEYNAVMEERDAMRAETLAAKEECDKYKQQCIDKENEAKLIDAQIAQLQADFENEKVRIQEESKKISMEQAGEALKIRDQAEAERLQIEDEKKAIIADIEQRQKDAQAELDDLVSQAKVVIAEAEEAAAKRDEMKAIIDEAKKIEEQRAGLEAQVAQLNADIDSGNEKLASIADSYDQAQRVIKDAESATVQAQALAEEIILDAEKRAVFLKEVSLSESDKGKMQKLIEAKDEQIKELQMEKDELDKKIADLEGAIKNLEQQIAEAKTLPAAISEQGPKEYSVEVVSHKSTGEVDSEGIGRILSRKSADGWKLNTVINDEGGKLQASLGTESASSLSMGAFSAKEDRVILIFERFKK